VKDKAKSAKTKKGRKKKAKAKAAKLISSGQHLKALPPPTRSYDPALLEISRRQWQHGQWAELAELDLEGFAHHPDRARLSLIVAAAHAQKGDLLKAHIYSELALSWGCSRTVAAQVLIASAYNTLGRLAACLQDDAAVPHFAQAARLVDPNADDTLLARSALIRETTRLGLPPTNSGLLETDLPAASASPSDRI
jgi:hypothetical protein